jgi:indole-3-glycerol phosphate synthase
LNDHDGLSIIAEIKRASPSMGGIREDLDPADTARQYGEAGIQAISVLTEKHFFRGCEEDLVKARLETSLPVLRKDFIIDMWQVYQSRLLGADAILLIAALLSDAQMMHFRLAAEGAGMRCLCEVHDEQELERALASDAHIIGINNRDLRTFDVDLKTTERLVRLIPPDRTVVSESGVSSAHDMRYLRELGVDAVLIGEALMRAGSIGEKIAMLRT